MVEIIHDDDGAAIGIAFSRNAVLLAVPDESTFIWGYVKGRGEDDGTAVEGEEMTKEEAVDMCATFLSIYAPDMLAKKQ